MTYTRFGTHIKILSYDSDSGMVTYERFGTGVIRSCHVSELKADGGITEIVAEAKANNGFKE